MVSESACLINVEERSSTREHEFNRIMIRHHLGEGIVSDTYHTNNTFELAALLLLRNILLLIGLIVDDDKTPARTDRVPPLGSADEAVTRVVLSPAVVGTSAGASTSTSTSIGIGVVVVLTPVLPAPTAPSSRSGRRRCRRRGIDSARASPGTAACSIGCLCGERRGGGRSDEGLHGSKVLLGLATSRVLVRLDGGWQVLLVLSHLGEDFVERQKSGDFFGRVHLRDCVNLLNSKAALISGMISMIKT